MIFKVLSTMRLPAMKCSIGNSKIAIAQGANAAARTLTETLRDQARQNARPLRQDRRGRIDPRVKLKDNKNAMQ